MSRTKHRKTASVKAFSAAGVVLVLAVAGLLALQNLIGSREAVEPSPHTVLDVYKCGDEEACMDTISSFMLAGRSAKELLAELDSLGKKDADVLVKCHPITHSIGRMLYKKLSEEKRPLADVFQQCDHTCHSGCFHGAMERLLFTEDDVETGYHVTNKILKEKVPTVCESFVVGLRGNLRFQCLHGIGHAIVFFSDYNLTGSLEICDLLPSAWDQDSCYGGAFMENVVASDKGKRYVSDDPHFPCNVLGDKYGKACYLMQTSRMLEMGLSYGEIAKECEKAGEHRLICMKSLGRDASNDARVDPKSADICTELETDDDTRSCITGLLYALADNSWDGRYAFPYCDSLPEGLVAFCYRTAIGYLAGSLSISKADILDSCGKNSSYADCSAMANV